MTKYDEVIPAGSAGKVTASVDVSQASGPIQKHVEIQTNDPEQPMARVFIKAVVKTYLEFAPGESVYFRAPKGETQTKDIVITPTHDKPILLSNPKVDSDLFDAKLQTQKTSSGKEQYILTVTLKPVGKIGTQKGNIKITATGHPQNEITLPVIAEIKGPIMVSPPIVAFTLTTFPEEVATSGTVNLREAGQPKGKVLKKLPTGSKLRVISENDFWYEVITGQDELGWVNKTVVQTSKPPKTTGSQTLRIQKSNGQNFKILNFNSSLKELKVELNPQNGGKNYNLTVSLLPFDYEKEKGQAIPGTIILKTDDTDQPEVNIPVRIIVS